MDALTKAAKKQQDRVRQMQKDAAPYEPTPRDIRKRANDVLTNSLAGTGRSSKVASFFDFAFSFLGFVSVPGALIYFMVTRHPDFPDILSALVAVPAAVAGMVVTLKIKRGFLSLVRKAAIRRIGRGFSAASYIEELSQQREQGELFVQLVFRSPWPEEKRTVAGQAVAGWVPQMGTGQWSQDGRTLTVLSETFDCTDSGRGVGQTGRWFTNRDVHGAFMRFAKKALPELEKVVPIEEFSAHIRGAVTPHNKDPYAVEWKKKNQRF